MNNRLFKGNIVFISMFLIFQIIGIVKAQEIITPFYLYKCLKIFLMN